MGTSTLVFTAAVDDPEDMEAINIMLEDVMPADNIDVCNTEFLPGSSRSLPISSDPFGETQITSQMFASIVRKNIGPNGLTHKQFRDVFSQLMDRLYFKLRHFRPCVFSKLVFDVSVEESELLQIAVTGMCTLNNADEVGEWWWPLELPWNLDLMVLSHALALQFRSYMYSRL